MTNIGKMRQRLTLQEETRSADGGGGAALAWADIATFWADIEPFRVQETLSAEKLAGVVTHKITVRAEIGITPAMRLAGSGRVFNILGVRNIGERGRFLEILAEEGSAT
jgi:SPP1 family predicted phage head-tail adaptor